MKKTLTIIMAVLCLVAFCASDANAKTRKKTARKAAQVSTNYYLPIGVRYYSTHKDARGNSDYFYMNNDTDGTYVTAGNLEYDFKVISKKGKLIMEWKCNDMYEPGKFLVFRYIGNVTLNPDNTVKTYKGECHYMKLGAKRAASKWPFEFYMNQ